MQNFEALLLKGHKDKIKVIQQDSQNPQLLLSVSFDEIIIVWDLNKMNIKFEYKFKEFKLETVTLSYPLFAYTTQEDNQILLYNLEKMKSTTQVISSSNNLPRIWILQICKQYLYCLTNGNYIIQWNHITNERIFSFKVNINIWQINCRKSFFFIQTQNSFQVRHSQNLRKIYFSINNCHSMISPHLFFKQQEKANFLVTQKAKLIRQYQRTSNKNQIKMAVALKDKLIICGFQQMNIFHICNQEVLKTTRTHHVYDIVDGKLIQDLNCDLEVVSDFY